ncbi:leucine-rich repeat transmembrane protein FLRT3-like [Scleropages formosus]|uniref:Leucine-rich repeat transmembrane protein FLRT3-like n=1 Tax=Scleropages formosus TaxID=113540 RepID=A0A0P7X4K1_SCLFO|nr:leucine-rich repeat transmembrane protein FLRT3-like [Scleropages formosus]
MAHNQLCDVDHLLQPFSDLQELSLSHNWLVNFPKGLPPSLRSLQLQENRITYLTAGGLRQLGNLTRLDLEGNRIRFIQPGAFLGLRKLQILGLKENRLVGFPISLPASLIRLDLSANCISSLDLTSLAPLVNLQVLKVNSNCLKSVPESAFDGLSRLRSVELADNLWVCECNILYLYKWLLNGRLGLATDLVCASPAHLASRLLLTLSVLAICPWALKPNNKVLLDSTTMSSGALRHHTAQTTVKDTLAGFHSTTESPFNASFKQTTEVLKEVKSVENDRGDIQKDTLGAHLLSRRFTLEELTYEECLMLNSRPAPTLILNGSRPHKDSKCTENSTSTYTTGDVTFSRPATPSRSTNMEPTTPFWMDQWLCPNSTRDSERSD